VMIILAGEAKLFHVAGQTDMLNWIVTCSSFADTYKKNSITLKLNT
jgi:hypothetical protein